MRRERIVDDQAFFAERIAGRAAGRRRSTRRAGALAAYLGVELDVWRAHPEQVVTVVGSKGKGTAATHASAVLAASGLRVGTLTSPGLRSNRERIRVDGAAIARADYETLVAEVVAALGRVSSALPDDGYLSPTGLFTLTALLHFARRGCAAVVLEAGMGGASDEVSLVAPGVVVVTPILGEHLGVLGDSVAAIAAEKAGVITAGTSVVVAARQEDRGAEAAIQSAARAHGCRQVVADWHPDSSGGPIPGLGGISAGLGLEAGIRLLELRDEPPPTPEVLDQVLRSVRLPGRLSRHRRGEQEWVVDCATNPAAITAALGHVTAHLGPPTAVLTFVPRHRDPAPLLEALRGQPVVMVPGGPPTGMPGGGAVMRLDAVDLDALGPRVLALGPVYFAGEVLSTLGVDCEESFTVPGRAR